MRLGEFPSIFRIQNNSFCFSFFTSFVSFLHLYAGIISQCKHGAHSGIFPNTFYFTLAYSSFGINAPLCFLCSLSLSAKVAQFHLNVFQLDTAIAPALPMRPPLRNPYTKHSVVISCNMKHIRRPHREVVNLDRRMEKTNEALNHQIHPSAKICKQSK